MVVLPELTVTEDLLPLEMGRVDVILGMTWLCNMGYMEVHWSSLTKTFTSDQQKVTLKGDPTLAAEVSVKMLTTCGKKMIWGSLWNSNISNRGLEKRRGRSLEPKGGSYTTGNRKCTDRIPRCS